MLITLPLWAVCGAPFGVRCDAAVAAPRPQDELMRAALRAEYPLQRREGTLQFGLAIESRDWTLGQPVHLRVYLRNDGPTAVSGPTALLWPHGFELFVALEDQELARWLPPGYPADLVEVGPATPSIELPPQQAVWCEWWLTLSAEQERAVAARGSAKLSVAAEDRCGSWEGRTGRQEGARTDPVTGTLTAPRGHNADAYQFLLDHGLAPLPPPNDRGGLLELKREDGTARQYEGGLLVFLSNHPNSVYAPYLHWLVATMARAPFRRREGPDAVEAEAVNLRMREHYRAVAERGLPGLTDQAWYKVAGAEWRLDNHEACIATLERLVQQFPGSPWAAEAREDLPRLRQLARARRGNEGR